MFVMPVPGRQRYRDTGLLEEWLLSYPSLIGEPWDPVRGCVKNKVGGV